MKHRMFFLLALCVFLGLPILGEAGELPPAIPKAAYPLLPAATFPDDAAARAAWKPMYDSAPVSVVSVEGRKALRMRCNFVGNDMERASWDWGTKLDLTKCQGLQFQFCCPDPTPVSYFSAYFKSGGGWYTCVFSSSGGKGWTTVTIDKTTARMEGTPAGWGKIDLMRISAWQAKDVDTEFYMADFGLLGTDAAIAIIRNESCAQAGKGDFKTVVKCVESTAGHLKALGLPYVVMSDMDLRPEHLKDKKLLILPYNPKMSPESVRVLKQFLQGGGKLISFYQLSPELASAVGMKRGRFVSSSQGVTFASMRSTERPMAGQPALAIQHSWNIADVVPVDGRSRIVAAWYDEDGKPTGHAAIVASDNCVHMTHIMLQEDAPAKRRLLLAMIGHLLPDVWPKAVKNALNEAGAVGGYGSFEEAKAGIQAAAAGDTRALELLAQAETSHAGGTALLQKSKYAEALVKAEEASAFALRAHCTAQKPLAGEHRAFWCHSAFGVDGMEWDEAIRTLADNGFTAILPNMLWGGVAFYKSDVLPVSYTVAERGDQIALCVAACKKYGVECHVWKVNWNMGSHVPKAFAERIKREKRYQVSYDGKAQYKWLCPSHPENQQLEIDSMVEVARKYEVDGIHFDYIRYPDEKHCYCAGCRARFEKVLGRKVAHWPADVGKEGALREPWLEFRRSQITKVVAAVNKGARAARPSIKISAAVFRNWPRDRDTIGQDWKHWCDKGYLDFACPMDYTHFDSSFENMVKQQLEWTGKVPCYPGIGLSCWPNPTNIARLIDQIKISRELKTGGFTVFNYGTAQAADVVPLCGMGITRKQAP